MVFAVQFIKEKKGIEKNIIKFRNFYKKKNNIMNFLEKNRTFREEKTMTL